MSAKRKHEVVKIPQGYLLLCISTYKKRARPVFRWQAFASCCRRCVSYFGFKERIEYMKRRCWLRRLEQSKSRETTEQHSETEFKACSLTGLTASPHFIYFIYLFIYSFILPQLRHGNLSGVHPAEWRQGRGEVQLEPLALQPPGSHQISGARLLPVHTAEGETRPATGPVRASHVQPLQL